MRPPLIFGGLLLSLSAAAAGGFFYGSSSATQPHTAELPAAAPAADELTPEIIAKWKASAMTTDYLPPRTPI
jgi:hypothetical protein